jgi:hypothetical protein
MNGEPTAGKSTSEGTGWYWGLLMAAVVLAISQWVYGEVNAAEAVGNMAAVNELLSNEYEVAVGGRKVDVYSARVLDPPFAGKEYNYGGPIRLPTSICRARSSCESNRNGRLAA